MQIDVPTLYALTVGTLCVAGAATLWERRINRKRSAEFLIWTAAYAAFGLGCALVNYRSAFPGIWGSALPSNLILLGYCLMLWGTARFDCRPLPRWPLALMAGTAVAWALFGQAHLGIIWNFISAAPIALVCCATGWMMWRSPQAAGLHSRRLAATISLAHGLFYGGRAALLPIIDALYGAEWLQTMAAATMFEAVLYSVALPMALIGLTREETQRDLVTLSQTDHLTQLGNRQAFFENGERILAECGPHRPAALLAFDLDHFKAINDRFGHGVGDEVLKLFGAVLKAESGPEACIARLGGEEFAALLPGLGSSAAGEVAERIGQRFSHEAARRDGLAMRASVSIGVAETGQDVSRLSALLLAADRALYRAKRLGRDRVEVGSEEKPVAEIRRRIPA